MYMKAEKHTEKLQAFKVEAIKLIAFFLEVDIWCVSISEINIKFLKSEVE